MGCHALLQGSFDPKIKSASLALAGRFFTSEPPGKSFDYCHQILFIRSLETENGMLPLVKSSSVPPLTFPAYLDRFVPYSLSEFFEIKVFKKK